MSESTSSQEIHQLDAYTQFYRPLPQAQQTGEPTPKLVILCTWMLAEPRHIAKYIKGYKALYPSASILTVQSSPLDFLYRGRIALEKCLQPAVLAVQSASSQTSKPEILLHVFSNGGSLRAAALFRNYLKTTGHPVPVHCTVLDSCPGHAQFHLTAQVLFLPWQGQPFYIRLPIAALLYIAFGLWWIAMLALRLESPFETLWQGLSNPREIKETKRVYIYSDADDMVPWHHIEDHAAEAKEKGFNVEMERFEGTDHVGHMRSGNGERYWGIVNKLWRQHLGSES